jgi:pimeloyl-ACP methyl ester carboxylesterase
MSGVASEVAVAPARLELLLVMLLAISVLASGCAYLRPARTPMERVSLRELGPAKARGAIVLLPGFGDRPQVFAEHGFADVLGRTAPDYDVFAADAHFGYYRSRSLLARLESDVVGPLRARGYRELWLVGASLGGFGAVAYARTYPERVQGLLLFAPYMGPKDVVEKVRLRGLCAYDELPSGEDSEENFARANFVWLKQQACVEASTAASERTVQASAAASERSDKREVPLFLGVGESDRLLPANRVLGAHLPRSHMLVLPGGHGWKVWSLALEKLSKVAFDSSATPH